MHTSKYDTFSSQELGLLHWTQEFLARWVGYGSGVRVNASYRCTVCVTVYFSIHRNGVTVNAENCCHRCLHESKFLRRRGT